jgi:hypothetical protein
MRGRYFRNDIFDYTLRQERSSYLEEPYFDQRSVVVDKIVNNLKNTNLRKEGSIFGQAKMGRKQLFLLKARLTQNII